MLVTPIRALRDLQKRQDAGNIWAEWDWLCWRAGRGGRDYYAVIHSRKRSSFSEAARASSPGLQREVKSMGHKTGQVQHNNTLCLLHTIKTNPAKMMMMMSVRRSSVT